MKIKLAEIINPKRPTRSTGFEGWYPYYAGYSAEFVSKLLTTGRINRKSVLLDPWNGSGTTTTTANKLGIQAKGFDLNPVMVLAAKSCLVSRYDYVSLNPIARKIVDLAENNKEEIGKYDPLLTWFKLPSAGIIRNLEKSIQILLFDENQQKCLADQINLDYVSSIAAFFYVALFRTVAIFVNSFRATNPTWIKIPENPLDRKSPTSESIFKIFLVEVQSMVEAVKAENIISKQSNLIEVGIGDSCGINLASKSVDLTISSPPYCTRIDYAIATLPELTLLGYSPKSSFDVLRRKLIGSATVSSEISEKRKNWGGECNRFLEAVYHHESKGSKTYYYKSHLQYFDSIYRSITEIERTLKNDGACVLVVQDSHYKEIYNNLPQITAEMASQVGLYLVREERFTSFRNMAKINPSVKKYRSHINATECVLCFKK